MGAWSHESFGNDDAADWAGALECILTAPSELIELWEEAPGEASAWRAAVEELKLRVAAGPGA